MHPSKALVNTFGCEFYVTVVLREDRLMLMADG